MFFENRLTGFLNIYLTIFLSLFSDLVRDSPLTVVLTDYSNYAIAYNCKNDDKKKSHEGQNIFLIQICLLSLLQIKGDL